MERFTDKGHRDAQAEFVRWQERNPRGYVLNLSSRKAAMMRRSLCSHVADYSDEKVSLTAKPKLCSTEAQELSDLCKRENLVLKRCRSCL